MRDCEVAAKEAMQHVEALQKALFERDCVLHCGPDVNNLGDVRDVNELLRKARKLLDC